MSGFIYILQGRDDRYYVGSTNDVQRRLAQHKNGFVYSTKRMLPIELVFYQEFASLAEARKVERRVKSAKSRAVIEEIIRRNGIQVF